MKYVPTPQQAHLIPGHRLDARYELLFPFAQGGMAIVWAARVVGKLGFEKLYAVKTILPTLSKDESFRAMFLDEARIASRIRHPNVASLEDLGEENGVLYMVLEWIHGDSMARLHDEAKRRGKQIPLDILLRIVADACAGLHAAHELRDDTGRGLRVVHRDVSPQNLMIATNGVTKVIDFGIAKARDRLAEQTRAGLLKGKVEYSAPEQVRNKQSDRRVDVWALGVILYHYASGRLPFDAKNDLETLRAIVAGTPPPPLPPEVPENVARVIATALRHRPEERFATALDMQKAIEACITAPTTANEVAAFLHEHCASRLESRRRDIAVAVEEMDARSGAPQRPRFASLPEIAPLEGPANPTGPSIEMPAETQVVVAELRAAHWVAMIVAILVTAAVWGAIGFVLTSPVNDGRASSARH